MIPEDFRLDRPLGEVLRELRLVDGPSEAAFDKCTSLIAMALKVPVSLISIIDPEQDRQFFKSQVGLAEPWSIARETPLSHSFCNFVAARNDTLVIEDARDHPLVSANPAIEQLGVVAYLGVPVRLPNNKAIGALCAITPEPRAWTAADREILAGIAECLADLIALRMALKANETATKERRGLEELYKHTPAMMHSIDHEGRIVQVSNHWLEILGYEREEVIGRKSIDFLTPDSVEKSMVYMPLIEKNDTVKNIELQMKKKSGEVIDILLSGIARKDPVSGAQQKFAVITDITAWRRTEHQFKIVEKRYQSIVETQEELVCRYTPDLVLTFVNGSYQRYFGRNDLIGKSFLELVPGHAHQGIRDYIALVVPGSPQTYEHEVKRPDGSTGWQQWTDVAIADERGRIVEFQSVGRDITSRKRVEQRVRHLAMTDSLVDLPNRKAFDETFQRWWARASRNSQPLALLLIDIDHFKLVNDTYGHQAGDSFLIEVTNRMKSAARQSDYLARLGGDEFALLMECPARPAFTALVGRMQATIRKRFKIGTDLIYPSVSIGVAVYPEDAASQAALMNAADKALYAAKAAGRGTWRSFELNPEGGGPAM